jgi:hypothetical protein
MAEQDQEDAARAGDKRAAQLRSVLVPFVIGLALPCGALAIFAAHLYYLDEGALWPLWLTGVAMASFGALAKASGYPPQGNVALGASVVVFIIAALLELPPINRSEQRSEFSTLAAMDAKIDRYLKKRQLDPSVIAAASFGGFDSGSDDLDCDGESARRALNLLLDGVERARERGQRSILVLIGMTDRMPLNYKLQKRYGSSAGLAGARADAVRSCLDAVSGGARRTTQTMETVRLTTGPTYTPQVGESGSAEAARMAQDRQVSALLFSLPVTAATPASAPASQPAKSLVPQSSPPAVDRDAASGREWRRVLLLILGVLGLAALAVSLRLRFRKETDEVPAIVVEETVPDAHLGEALTHVRDMHEMFAELRSKNFNFFIVIIAAAIAGAAGVTEKSNLTLQFISSLAAAVICIIFFGIENRTIEMLGDARLELERLEPKVGVMLSRRDKWVSATRPRNVTHTSLYRSAFLIAYFGALASIYVHYPW